MGGMPPIAKNVVDAAWIATATAPVNDPYDLHSVAAGGDDTKVRVTFNQPVESTSAVALSSYSIPGLSISSALMDSGGKLVTLTTSAMNPATTYQLTVNDVRTAAAPGNPIWPSTKRSFQLNVLDPLGDEDFDGIPNGVETPEGRSPIVKDNDIFTIPRLFAMQQYRDFLGREGDAAGISFWTDQLSTGAQSLGQMVETYFNSTEFQGTGAPVARLYFAYFLRIPDYAGLNYWIGQFRSGTSLEAISNAFAASAEFTNRYGALDDSQFVSLVYTNVLGRAPDSAGLAYWTGQLATLTRGQMMVAFSESAEYRALIGNQIYVTMIYVGMLRREPDSAGFAFWVDYMDKGNSGLALINGFLPATEYRNRFLP